MTDTEWKIFIMNICSPSPSESHLKRLLKSEYNLQILSKYRLPHITSMIIEDPVLMSKKWAEPFYIYSELVLRFTSELDGKEEAIRWIIRNSDADYTFLKLNIFPFISKKIADEIWLFLDQRIRDFDANIKKAESYVKDFSIKLSEAVGKPATGSLSKDANPGTKMPGFLEPLRAVWKETFPLIEEKCVKPSEENEHADVGNPSEKNESKTEKKFSREITGQDSAFFSKLAETLLSIRKNEYREKTKKYKDLKIVFNEFLREYDSSLAERKQKAISELSERRAFFVSEEAQTWGYTPDTEGEALQEIFESVYNESGNVAKTLAEFLCIEKEEKNQQMLLENIQEAILQEKIKVNVSEIYSFVQRCPACNAIVLNQLLQMQDEIVQKAIEHGKSSRSLDDEARKRTVTLHKALGEPVSAIERSLASFMSWKTYDEKKVLRFFKKEKEQVAGLRTALSELGLEPVIDVQDWVGQKKLTFDLEKHQGNVFGEKVIAKTMGFSYIDEFGERQILCAEVVDAPEETELENNAEKIDSTVKGDE